MTTTTTTTAAAAATATATTILQDRYYYHYSLLLLLLSWSTWPSKPASKPTYSKTGTPFFRASLRGRMGNNKGPKGTVPWGYRAILPCHIGACFVAVYCARVWPSRGAARISESCCHFARAAIQGLLPSPACTDGRSGQKSLRNLPTIS